MTKIVSKLFYGAVFVVFLVATLLYGALCCVMGAKEPGKEENDPN